MHIPAGEQVWMEQAGTQVLSPLNSQRWVRPMHWLQFCMQRLNGAPHVAALKQLSLQELTQRPMQPNWPPQSPLQSDVQVLVRSQPCVVFPQVLQATAHAPFDAHL